MFVGVGAKRARDLFEKARSVQPCIVFIDEIDAVGKSRSAGGMASNDEREQTINQLLTEMDGFDKDTQIIVLAATNRADLLDEALIRPGRFDRKISVSLPGVDGRERILHVHAKDKPLADDIDIRELARQTTGFSGADLANLLNECAIRAARDGVKTVTKDIVESTYQRIVVGARSDAIFSRETKELVAYHEAGHAVVGAFHPEYDLLRKISIIPRGDAGGVTYFTPCEDAILKPKSYYLAQIRVMLGGRAAEEAVYGPDAVTTGASSDYMHVYALARQMVTAWAFGEQSYDYTNAGPEAANRIDEEIDTLVKRCYRETLDMVIARRAEMEMIKFKLMEDEIVDGSWVYDVVLCNNQKTGCHYSDDDSDLA
jgi:cell division protease FtsH